MKLLWKIILILSICLGFSLNINGGYEFQTTFTPLATPHLTFDKNNFYLNAYGETNNVIKNMNLTFSITNKIYLNSMDLSLQTGDLNSEIFIKSKKGTSQDWLSVISADKLGDNYMGLILKAPYDYVFYALPDFSDSTEQYKTINIQHRFNFNSLFTSLLYSSRSSRLKTVYEDLYACDFSYELKSSELKGEIGFVNSNKDDNYDPIKNGFFMLGYQNTNDYIKYTQFSKGFSYSISSYQPMAKAEFRYGGLNGWYYKNLKVGGAYQPKIVNGKVEFSYYDPYASSVNIAGTFNGWNKNADPMIKDSEGVWKIDLSLSEGTYQYKFVVDGSKWVEDPYGFDYTDDGYGGLNSVITIINTASGIAISAPKDKFALNFSSQQIGNITFESNLRDEVNQTGNYLYKLKYSKNLGNFGIDAYVGYPEDNTSLTKPDSYDILIYLKSNLFGSNYEIGFKPLFYSPNFTDTMGYVNIKYRNINLNFTAFSDNTYNLYSDSSLDFKYGNIYFKGQTDFKNYNFYTNLNFTCFSPAIVQLSIGNSDFNTYKNFVKEIGLYVKATF